MLFYMKRMGIDFGSKKIGVAVTDDSGVMAFPKEVVRNDGKFLLYIEKFVYSNKIDEIVIGHSLNNEGKPNLIHSAVEELMMGITLSLGIPVHLEPEQYSTQQAIHLQGRSDMTDAAAASLILDGFITRQK